MRAKRLRRTEECLYSSFPLIGGWLRRRAASALVADCTPSAATVLAKAIAGSADKRVRGIALDGLRRWQCNQGCIDPVCLVWAETRHPELLSVIRERQWLGSAKGPEARVLTALKTEQTSALQKGTADIAAPLAAACDDKDPEIAARAVELLRKLTRKPLQEAICEAIIQHDSPTAAKVITEAGYVPADAAKRALFFFMTEQWAQYESLDFDHRTLRAFYEAAEPALRQRTVEKLRAAGRTDFLAVVVGGDSRSRTAAMTLGESELLVQTLSANREWARLWMLVFDLPFYWGLRAVRRLVQSDWKPDGEEDRAVFQELASLASEQVIDSEEEMRKILPPATQRAQARVPGRVNDVAFCPTRPVIAVGTGQRKLVLWDFQNAKRESVLSGFDHSIGLVAYSKTGALLCAERTNSDAECAVHGWNEGDRFLLGKHRGSVTALEPGTGPLVLVTGRDQRVVVWDTEARRAITEKQFDFWPRAACVAPSGEIAALIHNDTTIVTIPDLAEKRYTGRSESDYRFRTARLDGMAHCGTFSADSKGLLVGHHNRVVTLQLNKRDHDPNVSGLVAHPGVICGIHCMAKRPIAVTAGSDGTLRFLSWPNKSVVANLSVLASAQPEAASPQSTASPDERLLSIHISPDSNFMSLGNADGSVSLWDLRLLDVPTLINQPLAQATPNHIAGIRLAMEYAHGNDGLRRTLQFMECALRFRFRHDIDIDEPAEIQAGEFDIEVD